MTGEKRPTPLYCPYCGGALKLAPMTDSCTECASATCTDCAAMWDSDGQVILTPRLSWWLR
jgi:hypothetical protein